MQFWFGVGLWFSNSDMPCESLTLGVWCDADRE